MAGDWRVENGGGLYIGQEDEWQEEREVERLVIDMCLVSSLAVIYLGRSNINV